MVVAGAHLHSGAGRLLGWSDVKELSSASLRNWNEGVVIPGTYKHIHGEKVRIDPKTLDPHTVVMRS